VTDITPTTAALTTALTGSNNDLVFTARAGGTWGNSIQVAYIDPGGVSANPSVVVSGFLITVNLGRAASAINTTAARIMSLIGSSLDATKLVSVANASANDGSGLVTAMTATALTGGTYSVVQPALTNGDATNDHYFTGNDGRVVVEVVSTDAGVQTVTVRRAASFLAGTSLPDEVVSVGIGATRELGPFPADEFNQNSAGDVYFDPSVSNTLDFRAYRVTRAT
jgi:hypothetical protein